MIRFSRFLALAVAAVSMCTGLRPAVADETTAAVSIAPPASRPQPCISDWSEAGPIVRSEGLASIERVVQIARERASVEILTSALCKSDDRFTYRLTVRSQTGALRSMFVDARRPFER